MDEVYIVHHWCPDAEGDGVGLSHTMEVAWKVQELYPPPSKSGKRRFIGIHT